MTGHLTGTAGVIFARRDECEEAIQCLVENGPVDAKAIQNLRRQLGGELADLVVSVAALQDKANKKLGPKAQDSLVWWVTDKSLQQASAWQVAQLKSTWFDRELIYDLCCGIGGDAIHLARRGRLVAVDSDGVMVEMATANLAASDAAQHADVCRADAATIEIPDHAGVHIDPDRRIGGDRKSSPDSYQPAWSQVIEIAKKSNCAVVKLAPAAKLESASLSFDDIGATHRCWISLSGSVREQSLLLGETIQRAGLTPGTRSAVSVRANGSAFWFAPVADDQASVVTSIASKPLSILIDPDPSIRAAGLTEAFAHMHGLQLLGHPSGFLTSDRGSLSTATAEMAIVRNVIWSGTCDDRKLRREFRNRGIFPAAIKVRGTNHDPNTLAKRYRKCGDDPVTLWIGRTGQRAFAAITEQ